MLGDSLAMLFPVLMKMLKIWHYSRQYQVRLLPVVLLQSGVPAKSTFHIDIDRSGFRGEALNLDVSRTFQTTTRTIAYLKERHVVRITVSNEAQSDHCEGGRTRDGGARPRIGSGGRFNQISAPLSRRLGIHSSSQFSFPIFPLVTNDNDSSRSMAKDPQLTRQRCCCYR